MAASKGRKTSTRKSTGKKKSSAGKRKSSAPRRMTQKERAQRNQIWAVVLFFFALLSLLAMVHVEAPFVDFIGKTARRCIGGGVFALPVALVFAGILLFISRGKPIKNRVFCTLITPVLIGCLVHSIAGDGEITKPFAMMLEDGNTLSGGGLISGYTAAFLVKYISRFAAIPLFLLLTLLTVCGAFNITFMDIVDKIGAWLADRPRGVEYDEEPEPEPEPIPEPARPVRRRRPNIDIPLDGEEQPESTGIKLRDARVKSPAEVLAETQIREEEPAPVTPTVQENSVVFEQPEPDPIPPEAVADIPVIDIAHEETPDTPPSDVQPEPAPEEAEGFHIPEESMAGEQKELYSYPPITLLNEPKGGALGEGEDIRALGLRLAETIKSFGIEIHLLGVVRGPTVTRYEVQLDPGVKLARLTGLSDDIALSLGASSIYIAPIPDKSAIGIEVPNKNVQMVTAREVIASREFNSSRSNVTFAMGKDILGNCIICDISKLPHLLIAGTTGSGKSVCMNTLITSILYKSSPEQVRFIMIDPKVVELSVYNGIPHLLVPVVTDPRKAAGALQWAVNEMMRRYKLFADTQVRDLKGYNELAEKTPEMDTMPQIVVVIDELADLIVVAKKEVEDSIMRLTQMARAAGMHLVVATQRPSADVITGVIKSNIPSRIAFSVASRIESNIILGVQGAEKLIGKGDMLYAPIGVTKPTRIQGCFISDEEVKAVVDYIKRGVDTEYSNEIIEQIERQAERRDVSSAGEDCADPDADEMLDSAIEVVVETGQASVSMLQRRLKLGYSRAARIVDQMEARGVVGPFEGAKPRQVLISKEQWQEMKMRRES